MEDMLKATLGKDPGFIVPEGYFDSFYKEMGEKLPPYKGELQIAPLSKWQRVKPYLYLAAMFAGIWMTMKVFHNVYKDSTLNLENPPEHIAMLMASDPDYDLYAEPQYGYDDDLDSLIDSYDNVSQLEKEMGIRLEPSYANIDIEGIKEDR